MWGLGRAGEVSDGWVVVHGQALGSSVSNLPFTSLIETYYWVMK